MGCPKLYEDWVFLRGGEKHLLFPRKPREKNRSRSAPAEMDGGEWNLYAMVGNDPVDGWDYLGNMSKKEAIGGLETGIGAMNDYNVFISAGTGVLKAFAKPKSACATVYKALADEDKKLRDADYDEITEVDENGNCKFDCSQFGHVSGGPGYDICLNDILTSSPWGPRLANLFARYIARFDEAIKKACEEKKKAACKCAKWIGNKYKKDVESGILPKKSKKDFDDYVNKIDKLRRDYLSRSSITTPLPRGYIKKKARDQEKRYW
jgi:hypothetical protein